MTRKRKRLTYPDQALPCQICGRHFKSLQGLSGHQRMIHGISAGPGASSVAPGASAASSAGSAEQPSIKELRAEVDELKLQVEKRKLQAELPKPATEPADIMAQLGLGPFDPAVRAEAQRRAMGATENKPQQSWLDKLLSSPEGVKVAVDGLRGVLGVGRGESGDNLSTLLKDLGFNLKDLLLERAAPKGDAGLTIGGVNLAGTSLTPELLKSILEYRSVEEKARLDAESRKLMADGLKDAIGQLAPAFADLAASRQGGPGIQRRPGAGPELQDPEPQFAECPRCGRQIPIPANFPGGELHCQTKLADGSACLGSIDLEIIEDRPESKARGKKRKPKPEPMESVKCPGCGQLVGISDKQIGDKVCCPVCQTEFAIISDIESVQGLEPLSDQDRALRDKKGGL